MDPAEYKRTRDLFHRIAEFPPEDRRTEIETAALSEEAQALLASLLESDEDSSLLGATSMSRTVESLLGDQVPERIAEFRITGVLGRGGMGVVYRAVQDRPRREVAIKVLSSVLASPDSLRRFEYEAEILGRLDHPYVAKVFQARVDGTGDTGPFLVMELVEGTDLVTWCDEHGLDDRGRIELVLRVCEGVEHAHQRGVVHRDLKPANVLVSSDGRPRILDFGIARPLQEDDASTPGRTVAGEVVGSLSWMSPEQARGEIDRIDVRTDVYAIGVILYRLLTGRMPHEVKSLAVWEAARRISEEEPTRLGRLRKELRGDLEAIVSTALEKDPERRYRGAGALAADLERFLADEPVEARPWSGAYQLRKLARRHRVLIGTGALVLVAVLAGLVASLVQWRRAEGETLRANVEAGRAKEAAERADLEARRAEEVAKLAQDEARTNAEVVDFLVDLFDKSAAYSGAKDVTVRELLDVAVEDVDERFEDEPGIRTRILTTMGLSYTALGLLDRGEDLVDLALETATNALAEDDRARYGALSARATLLAKRTRYDEARELFDRCIEGYARLLGPHALPTLQARQDRVQTLVWRADRSAEHVATVEDEIRDVRAEYERWWPEDDAARILLTTYADFLLHQGRVEEAEEVALDALERCEEDGARGTPEVLRLSRIVATSARHRGAPEEALEVLERARADAQDVLPARHPALVSLGIDLGLLLMNMGRVQEADPLLTDAAETAREVLGEESLETQRALFVLANVRRHQGRLAEAAEILETVWRSESAGLGPRHRSTLESEQSLAAALGQLGETERALERFESVHAAWSEVEGPASPKAFAAFTGLAESLAILGRWEELDEATSAVVEVHRSAFGDEHPGTLRARILRTRLALRESASAEHVDELARAVDDGRALVSGDPIYVIGLGNLVVALLDTGQGARAVPYAEELVEVTAPGSPRRAQSESMLERARAAAR